MNERIRELSAVAKNLATDEAIHLSRVHNRTLSLDEEQEIFTKKFAELIVRECIKESMEEIVSDEDIPEINDPCAREYLKGNNQGIVDAVVRFRNHFGVEEVLPE